MSVEINGKKQTGIVSLFMYVFVAIPMALSALAMTAMFLIGTALVICSPLILIGWLIWMAAQ